MADFGDYKHDVGRTECQQEGCTESLPNHAWGRIKADGWFQMKNGQIWCPKHRPEWYASWRRGKKRT